jgi:hypothetical protein
VTRSQPGAAAPGRIAASNSEPSPQRVASGGASDRGGSGSFPCVQFEFGFLLGPPDGRYLAREGPDADAEYVVVLRTLGATQRRLLRRRRRPRRVDAAEPALVPTARATVISAQPFESPQSAERWLSHARRDRDALDAEISRAAARLNRLLAAHRAASADAYARDVSATGALVVRVGHGDGERVAHGGFASAYEVPPWTKRKRRTERLSPQEHLAAMLGGREPTLAADELVLRARSDLERDRPREAALQARVALECVLEELAPERLGEVRAELEADHEPVSQAAAAAVSADPPPELNARVRDAVAHMERALRRHRTGSSV